MARRKSDIQADAPGQDSFLDVVANLVGIMIILIMVVGFAAKKAIVESDVALAMEAAQGTGKAAEAKEKLQKDLTEAEQAMSSIETDIHQTNARIEREKFEVAFRRTERDKVLTLISAAERAIQDRRGDLDATQQQQFDLNQQIAALRNELDEVRKTKAVVERSGPIPGVIEHLPTPMAKTVFGTELHFRLLGHRLVYLPWDELVERLKADAPSKVRKLQDAPRITETLGPIQGFWMRYTLKRTEKMVSTAQGSVVQQRVELDRFSLVSESDDVGEFIDQSLSPQSELHNILRSHDPSRTTVTVWVYPDSFGDFRRIKQDLFKLGYLCAARPLPDGHPIGGSPEGSRSAAQ